MLSTLMLRYWCCGAAAAKQAAEVAKLQQQLRQLQADAQVAASQQQAAQDALGKCQSHLSQCTRCVASSLSSSLTSSTLFADLY